MLNWVAANYHEPDLILWGQSIGAGVASAAAAGYYSSLVKSNAKLAALILETPFTSIKRMLLALYPQKWLPYQYLHPFLWNHWDTEAALQRISKEHRAPKVLLMPATRDEVVPAEEIIRLERLCNEVNIDHERYDVMGALHTEASTRREGQEAIARFIAKIPKIR